MKKKIIVSVIWIVISIFYCWSLSDIGGSIGAFTNSAIEKYSEMKAEYGGTTTDIKHLGSAMGDMFIYRMYNLKNEFKTFFTIIAVLTIVYILFSIYFYHFIFVKTDKEKDKEM